MTTDGTPPKSKRYSAVKTRFFFADLILTIVALAAFQFGASRAVSQAVTAAFTNFYLACFVYVGVFLLFMYIVTFPLHLANSFFVERFFDLSDRSFSSWALDEVKAVMLSLLLWVLCAEVFYFVLRNFPHAWWVIASCLWIFFSIALSRLLPILIIPIFYKYIPIEDNELKRRILALADKARVNLTDVCQIDFSRKTRKANAALVGLGNTRKVILADTLTREFTLEEVESVVAHEFGHFKYRHIWQLLIFSGIITMAGFFLLSVMAERIVSLTGATGLADLYLFPVFLLLLTVFGLAILPAQNLFSRILERQADRFALSATADAGTFVSVMKKLASMNLADEDPPLWKKIFFYSHPPIKERIEMAKGSSTYEGDTPQVE
jgi:STE24 endopeptidase